MDNQSKEVFGAWLSAVGTIIAAIGSTPSHFIKSSLRQDLNLWGNVLQAVGNAIEADGQEDVSLETIGNEIQSFGNISVIAGLIIKFKDETQKKLIITGNWIQALGGAVAVGDEFEDVSNTNDLYSIVGNLLQVIGNSLQALDGVQELKNSRVEENKKDTESVENREDEDKWSLDVIGSWIQAIGSVISLIGQIIEEKEEQKNKDKQTEKLTDKNEKNDKKESKRWFTLPKSKKC